MSTEENGADAREVQLAAEQAHRDRLASRLEGIDDPEERASEIVDQYVRHRTAAPTKTVPGRSGATGVR